MTLLDEYRIEIETDNESINTAKKIAKDIISWDIYLNDQNHQYLTSDSLENNKNDKLVYFLAYVDGETGGSAILNLAPSPNPGDTNHQIDRSVNSQSTDSNTPELLFMGIKKEFRCQGLGKKLIKRIISHVYEQGLRAISLQTSAPAKAFFLTAGFIEIEPPDLQNSSLVQKMSIEIRDR